ncbi:MAG: acyltransferase family protein [Acidobacteriaceae bacterium]
MSPSGIAGRTRSPAATQVSNQAGKLKHPDYRPDIDGLRAVAVLSVIAYHAFPAILPGGFIGVDLFFVISGFLISSIIFASVEAGTFSYIDFYKRRIKRIFPALIVLLLAVLAFGWLVLFAPEFRQLGAQTFAASVFVSNIALWREAGYFDTASSYKPLLHLWSLGVEEQFYIFWPLLVGIAWRRWGLLWLTAVLGTASFLLNLFLTHSSPESAYFLPFSRFWELMIGGALAYWLLHRNRRVAVAPHLQSILGILLVAAGLVFITASSPFPGWRALFPTVGAFLLISAGPQAFVNRFFLSNPWMVGIGLISYPLYLWHWPLFSYLDLMEGGTTSTARLLCAIALAFLLAWLTYRFVEKPLRHRRNVAVPIALLSALLLVGCSGPVIWKLHGLPSRSINRLNVSDYLAGYLAGIQNPETQNQCGLTATQMRGVSFCLSDKREAPVYALLGDSKAGALIPGLIEDSKPGGRWLVIAGTGPESIPLVSTTASDAVLRNPQIRVVVLTLAVRTLFGAQDRFLADLPHSPNSPAAFQFLDRMIAKFSAAGKTVVITVDNPTLADPQLCMTRRTQFALINALFAHPANSHCSISIAALNQQTGAYRSLLSELAAKWPGTLTIFDPAPELCDLHTGICPAWIDGHMLYSYSDHISDFASLRIAQSLIPVVERSSQTQPSALPPANPR